MEKNQTTSVDLTFGPAWARQSAEKWVLSDAKQSTRQKSPWQKRDGKPPLPRRSDNFSRRTADPRDEKRRRFKPNRQQVLPDDIPNIKISFIPERRGLKPLVKQLSGTRRAYSLFEVASTFLSKPEFYAAALETTNHSLSAGRQDSGQAGSVVNAAGQEPSLYQCAECKAVFTNKRPAITHALNRHLNLFYEREEKEGEAPQGNFLCVARCALSGELLSPPNYHGFNEKLQELHRTRFADMPIDEYRKKIVNETDPALIEQWKKTAARKIIYRTKLPGEPLVFERNSQLERHFIDNYAPALIRAGTRFVVPATTAQDLEDQQIKKIVQEAWKKEVQFPINMAFAIQKRFRRLGLHIFKTSARISFVSSVRPHPLDPAQTTETIRNILEWIDKNNGKTRRDLAAALAPGLAPESEQVADIINALFWLIDRGHIIEFMNGKLTVPNEMIFTGNKPGKFSPIKSEQQDAGANDHKESTSQREGRSK